MIVGNALVAEVARLWYSAFSLCSTHQSLATSATDKTDRQTIYKMKRTDQTFSSPHPLPVPRSCLLALSFLGASGLRLRRFGICGVRMLRKSGISGRGIAGISGSSGNSGRGMLGNRFHKSRGLSIDDFLWLGSCLHLLTFGGCVERPEVDRFALLPNQ